MRWHYSKPERSNQRPAALSGVAANYLQRARALYQHGAVSYLEVLVPNVLYLQPDKLYLT